MAGLSTRFHLLVGILPAALSLHKGGSKSARQWNGIVVDSNSIWVQEVLHPCCTASRMLAFAHSGCCAARMPHLPWLFRGKPTGRSVDRSVGIPLHWFLFYWCPLKLFVLRLNKKINCKSGNMADMMATD